MKPSLIKFQADKTHNCWYCNAPKPTHLLTEPDGSEARVCLPCGKKHFKKFKRKIKKTLNSANPSSNIEVQQDLSQNNEGKNPQVPAQSGGSAQ